MNIIHSGPLCSQMPQNHERLVFRVNTDNVTWSPGLHRWPVADSAWFFWCARVSVHRRPADFKVGNHPSGLSLCGKPIGCAHSAVPQSGDLRSFVERVVHVMQTEICPIPHSHPPPPTRPPLSLALAKNRGAQRTCRPIAVICLLVTHDVLWEVQRQAGTQGGSVCSGGMNSLMELRSSSLCDSTTVRIRLSAGSQLSPAFFGPALKFHLVLTVGVSSGLGYCVHKFNLLLLSLRPSQSPCYDWLINCTIRSISVDI